MITYSTIGFEMEYGTEPYGMGDWVFSISTRGRYYDTFRVYNHTYEDAQRMLAEAVEEEGLADVKATLSTMSYMLGEEEKDMFRKFVERIIEAPNQSVAIETIFYGSDGIDMAFQREKITWEDHQMLLALIEKMA